MKRLLLILVLAFPAQGQMLQAIVGQSAAAPGDGTWTTAQHPAANVACGSPCSYTLTQTTATGNLIVIASQGSIVTGVTGANSNTNTVTYDATRNGGLGAYGWNLSYILPSNNTAVMTSPLSVTTSPGTSVALKIWEFHPSANGANVGLAGLYSKYAGGVTSTVGPTFTLAGTNCAIVHAASATSSVTSANSPYNTNFETDANGDGWSYVSNTTTGTGPTWNLGSGDLEMGGVAFCFNTTAPPKNWMLIDGDTITTGTTVSTTNLATGSQCAYGSWTGTLTSASQWSTASPAPLNLLTSISACNATQAGTTGRIIDFDTTSTNVFRFLPHGSNFGGSRKASIGFWWRTNVNTASLSNDDLCDAGSINNVAGTFSAVVQLHYLTSGSVLSLRMEKTNPTTYSSEITISTNTTYWVTLQYDGTATSGTNSMAVYDTSGNQVGSTVTLATNSSGGNVSTIQFEHVGSCFATAQHYSYGNIKIDPSGESFPVLP